MANTASVVVAFLLAGLAVFQGALVAGKPLGRFAWGGQHRVLPMGLRIGSVVSIVIYAGIALVLLDRANLISVFSSGFVSVSSWVIVAFFVIGIFMNAMSRSKPERLLMTPLNLVLAALSVVVAAQW